MLLCFRLLSFLRHSSEDKRESCLDCLEQQNPVLWGRLASVLDTRLVEEGPPVFHVEFIPST